MGSSRRLGCNLPARSRLEYTSNGSLFEPVALVMNSAVLLLKSLAVSFSERSGTLAKAVSVPVEAGSLFDKLCKAG